MHSPTTGDAPPSIAQTNQNQPPQQQQQQPQLQNQQPMSNQPTQIPQEIQIQQQQQELPQPINPNEIRTLWIGDLQYWMDETYIFQCFVQTNEVTNVKVIRSKQTIQPEGYAYGFIEFVTREAAERVLQTVNGTLMPNTEQNFRLNWASAGERRNDNTPEYTIFVGDLAMDVTDNVLQERFSQHYASVKGAKVVIDKVTGRVKGYGFVMFSNESEQRRAMVEMNGRMCSSRPMRIGAATNKSSQGNPSESDPNNTTIFVGGLDSNVSNEALTQVFRQFGEIIHVKIPVGKRCGFVQFTERRFAEQALQVLNGTQLEGQTIRLSWGRLPSNRQNSSAGAAAQPQAHANGLNSGHYNYANGFEPYVYMLPVPQDPNMYHANGYAGYGNYHQPPPPHQQ